MGIRHKTLYLIRHGETASNVEARFQGSDEPLTELGREQAGALAARLLAKRATYPITTLITSSDRRAYDSALIIAHALELPISLSSALFVERRHPTKIWGKLTSDTEAAALCNEARIRFHDPAFAYDDGETFNLLKARALRAMAYILALPHKHIALVTHGVFGTTLAAISQRGAALTSYDLDAYQFRLDNTGFSIFGYETRTNFSKTSDGWVIHKWNDTAHLELNSP